MVLNCNHQTQRLGISRGSRCGQLCEVKAVLVVNQAIH